MTAAVTLAARCNSTSTSTMDSLHSLPQNSHPTTINAHPVNPYSRGDFSQHFNNNSQVSMQHHNNLQSWPVHSHFPPQNASLSQHLYSQNAGVCNAISSQNGAIHPNQHNLAMNSMPYISSQIMQDALRLSAPVGSSPNDEALMVQILYESPLAGQTYKQALESLHGVCLVSLDLSASEPDRVFRLIITPRVFGKIIT